MPVMITSSGPGFTARCFLPVAFDFFGFWPEDRRDFMKWIVASACQPLRCVPDCRVRYRHFERNVGGSGRQKFENQIVSNPRGL